MSDKEIFLLLLLIETIHQFRFFCDVTYLFFCPIFSTEDTLRQKKKLRDKVSDQIVHIGKISSSTSNRCLMSEYLYNKKLFLSLTHFFCFKIKMIDLSKNGVCMMQIYTHTKKNIFSVLSSYKLDIVS